MQVTGPGLTAAAAQAATAPAPMTPTALEFAPVHIDSQYLEKNPEAGVFVRIIKGVSS